MSALLDGSKKVPSTLNVFSEVKGGGCVLSTKAVNLPVGHTALHQVVQTQASGPKCFPEPTNRLKKKKKKTLK